MKNIKEHPLADRLYQFKERHLQRHYKFYQPEDLTEVEWRWIEAGNLEPFMRRHLRKDLDRMCIDRSIMIRNAMRLHFNPKGHSLLDLGCNTGWQVHFFAREGMEATGIDSNSHNAIKGTTSDAKTSVIATAQRLAKKYGVKATFIEDDLLSWLKDAPKYDVVLCLSLFHHFFEVAAGYGVKKEVDTDALFKQIASKAKKLLYFEIDHRIADKHGWPEEQLPALLKEKGDFKEVRFIGISIDAYKKYRNLYECIR